MLFCKTFTRTSHPVVFLHGFMGSHVEGLGFTRSSILSWELIDLPGHGKTAQQGSFNCLIKLLDDIKRPFHLVGYSLGGRIAQKLAHHPKTLSLTLISSDTLFTDPALVVRQAFEGKLFQALHETSLETFLETWYSQPLFASLKNKKSLFKKVLERRSKQSKEDLLFSLKTFSVNHIISDLPSCPILGLYGRLDHKYQKLYTSLPSTVQVVSIDNAGHALHLENPKQTLTILEQFIGAIENDLDHVR